MIRAGADHGAACAVVKPERDVHAFFNAEILHRNQPLVVIHRDHDIPLCKPSRLHENGIRRETALHVDAHLARCFHRRVNDLDFLATKQPALASMRVQPRHRDARRAPQGFLQRIVRDLQGLQHVVLRHPIQRFSQTEVNADQNGSQLIVGQHHAHRHVVNRYPGILRGLRLEQFGVSGKTDSGCGPSLFVNRRGHHSRYLAAQGHLRGLTHTLGREISCQIAHQPIWNLREMLIF